MQVDALSLKQHDLSRKIVIAAIAAVAFIYAAWQLATKESIPIEACLADRYFKCAIGLCGQCTVDPLGLRLCIDGPVFDQNQLKEISDFGKFARDKFGRKEPF